MSKRLINCDLGECLVPNPDNDIMPFIDVANIACGGHIGDDTSMIQAIQLAKHHSVKIGAHPSYADTENFGRISQKLSDKALYDLLYQQISHFQKLCHENDAILEYIKPHGALYHDMMCSPVVFKVICKVIQTIDECLSLVVQAGVKNLKTDTSVLYEVFADRAYNGNKILPRSAKGAVLKNADIIVEQYQKFLIEQSFQIDTICFHSDNPASINALQRLRNA
ncbi:MAG: 5-oxoprolinase subunit PxpA [Gammaproteobacteria bacterium]|nr:5-oxoprolinase subunit PxpA [Gammaproteobacteria bacterium]